MRARIDAIGARRSRPATGRSPSEGVAGCGLVGRIAVMPTNLSIQAILRDVVGSTGHRYAAKDNAGNTMDTVKIKVSTPGSAAAAPRATTASSNTSARSRSASATQPTSRIRFACTRASRRAPTRTLKALLTPKTPTVVAIQIRRRRVGAVTIQRTPADGAADGTEPPHGTATSSVATDA